MKRSSRRRLGASVGALLLAASTLAAPGARAQGTPPRALPEGHPPLTADPAPARTPGEGTIRGSLVHREGDALPTGIEVVLYALSVDGNAGLRRTTSDSDGRFEFDSIVTDPGHVYMVGTRVGEVPFGTRVAFGPGESEREIEIEILATSHRPDAIEAGRARLRLQQGCTHLRVWHTHTVENETQRVIFVPPELRGEREPLLSVEVVGESESLVIPTSTGFDVEGNVARFWGPLYPGRQELEFGYGVPLRDSEISLGMRSSLGASELEIEIPGVLGAPRGGELQAPASGDAGTRVYTRPGLGVREAFEWQQPTAARAQRAAVETPVSQLWLELDDAVLAVNESHQLRVPVSLPESELPLLCITLPEGARNPRFSGDSMRWGLSRDPSGVLSLHGPLPAGEPTISLRYDVPVPSEPMHFERRLGSARERLEVVVADTGVAPLTDRLHPLRAIHSDGRNYLRLEGFAIEPGEVISVDLARLASRGGSEGQLAAVASGLGALAAIAFLTAPLLRGRSEDEEVDEDSALRGERESIYRALDDLDEDLETGKLSPEDHEQMRGELRARAASLLRAEREGHATPSSPMHCPGCGRVLRLDDRFCSQCGQAITAAAPPDNSIS